MKRNWLVVPLAALLACGAAWGAARLAGSDRLPAGMTAGGLALGGLTADEALARLNARIDEALSVRVAALSPDGRTPSKATLTLRQLGMTIRADEAAAALRRFREAGWWERARMRSGLSRDYGFAVAWDKAAMLRAAQRTWGGLVPAVPARSARRTIGERDEVVYVPEQAGSGPDWGKLAADVMALAPKSLAAAGAGVDGGGADGGAGGGGRTLAVRMAVAVTEPPVTVAKLKAQGIERKIAEFTTSFASSGDGRSHNVEATAKALDGTLLAPGEVFAYDRIVAKAERTYGWEEAPVIVKGRLTTGVGGGICQVSSTLYNAALAAGLDIVERRNHSLAVHYLPLGLDATFAEGYINFRFRNSTGKYLLIRTEVTGKRLTVKLFGTMPRNVKYRMETRRLKATPPKVVYVGNDRLAVGEADVLQRGEPGVVVESYRLKFVDGRLVSREKLSRDTYLPRDELVAVNPRDPRLASAGAGPGAQLPSLGLADSGPVEPL
jgi:hypothetical protein